MKVMLVNGSPHNKGNTNEALKIVEKELNNEGIETEIFWIGSKPIGGCVGCHVCAKIGKCIFDDDVVNGFVEKCKDVDAYIFGSPVYYASMAGNFVSFMDRVFYSASLAGHNDYFAFKPVASVITARRAGTTATYDQLNKYFGMNQMPIISTRYWNMVHTNNADTDLLYDDKEGVQLLQMMGRNMAYYLKCIESGKKDGILPPEQEEYTLTNFIR